MILAVTLLVTSAQLGIAAEAFVVPAGRQSSLPPVSIVAPAALGPEQTAWAALLERPVQSGPVQGGPRSMAGVRRVPLEQVPRLTRAQLFTQLGLLDGRQLDAVLDRNPGMIASLLARPPRATETAATWSAMSATSRQALVNRAPRLIGNLEGIPYPVRDRANRADVRSEISAIQKRLGGGVGRAAAGDLRARLHMLGQVKLALKPTDGIPRQLVALDTSGEGTAVISIGDLAAADYVSYLVPGMFYGVDSRLVPWTGIAAQLAADQRSWLQRLGRGDRKAAVLSWIGYRTPTLVDVASMTDARQGGVALAASLRGLSSARSASQPYVSVLAHSYGATAALLALDAAEGSAPRVDALAMVGSPGSPARSVADLSVAGRNVWVGAARWDPISQSGVFGSQPTSASYGARPMGVDGGTDPLTRRPLTGTLGHNDYFSPGSETLRNFALIGIGATDYVMQPGGRMLAAG